MDNTNCRYSFEKCSFIRFIIFFGLKNVRRETVRILGRAIKERSYNHIITVKSPSGEIVGYGVIRKIPSKYKFASQEDSIIGPY